MKIVATYSYSNGEAVINQQFASELAEVQVALASAEAELARIKVSKEKTMPGRVLYSPKALNRAILEERLYTQGWVKARLPYETTIPETGETYKGYLECDGVKNNLGLEIQFGKYAFLGWDVLGKAPILAKAKIIRAGIEVTPMRSLVRGSMSTGIGCFEQLKAILEYRGVSNLDIPVLVIGVAADTTSGEEAILADEEAGGEANGIE